LSVPSIFNIWDVSASSLSALSYIPVRLFDYDGPNDEWDHLVIFRINMSQHKTTTLACARPQTASTPKHNTDRQQSCHRPKRNQCRRRRRTQCQCEPWLRSRSYRGCKKIKQQMMRAPCGNTLMVCGGCESILGNCAVVMCC